LSDSQQIERRVEKELKLELDFPLDKSQCSAVDTDSETIFSSADDHIMSINSPSVETNHRNSPIAPVSPPLSPLSLHTPVEVEVEPVTERPIRPQRVVHWAEEKGPFSAENQTIIATSLVVVEPLVIPQTTSLHNSTSLLMPLMSASSSLDLFSTRRGSMGFSRDKDKIQATDERSGVRSGRSVLKRKPDKVIFISWMQFDYQNYYFLSERLCFIRSKRALPVPPTQRGRGGGRAQCR
jgi:hypothetical protein